MNQNPEKILFFKEYCKKHPSNVLQYVCDRENCDHFLTFQCYQCRQDNVSQHSHECPKLSVYVKKLHAQVISKLTANIKQMIGAFKSSLLKEINELLDNLQLWYSPMDETTTQKQFVHTVVTPSKWHKIQETSLVKDGLINSRLRQTAQKYRKQMEQVNKIVGQCVEQLKYKIVPLEWKFDKTNSHELLNISGFKDKIVDKKSDKQKYCVAILNQPLTPMKNQVSFTINSQNLNDQCIVLGVCSKRVLIKDNFQTDLKKGIYAIYQATKPNCRNNALSLHSSNQQMHYKQAVGWNFRSGDSISINFEIMQNNSVRIQFKKKKQIFELFIQKSIAFLHPFVALFSSGDKVSIDYT